jgi:hypothetical protein
MTGTIDSGVPGRSDGGIGLDIAHADGGRSDTDMNESDARIGDNENGPSDSGLPDGEVPNDAGFVPFNDAGCLTVEGASQFCGFSSNEQVCNFSVSCETSSSLSQCKINCEMGTTVRCYMASDVVCIGNAVQNASCTDFNACNWIF